MYKDVSSLRHPDRRFVCFGTNEECNVKARGEQQKVNTYGGTERECGGKDVHRRWVREALGSTWLSHGNDLIITTWAAVLCNTQTHTHTHLFVLRPRGDTCYPKVVCNSLPWPFTPAAWPAPLKLNLNPASRLQLPQGSLCLLIHIPAGLWRYTQITWK